MSSAQSHDPHGLEAGDLRPDARLPEGFLEEFAATATGLSANTSTSSRSVHGKTFARTLSTTLATSSVNCCRSCRTSRVRTSTD